MRPDTRNEIQLKELWFQNIIILSRSILEWKQGSARSLLVLAHVVWLRWAPRGIFSYFINPREMHPLTEQCMKLEQKVPHLILAICTGVNNDMFWLASFKCALLHLGHFTWLRKNISVVVLPRLYLLVIFTQNTRCYPAPIPWLSVFSPFPAGQQNHLTSKYTDLFFVHLQNEHSRPRDVGATLPWGPNSSNVATWCYMSMWLGDAKKAKGINNKQTKLVTFVQKPAGISQGLPELPPPCH